MRLFSRFVAIARVLVTLIPSIHSPYDYLLLFLLIFKKEYKEEDYSERAA